MHITSTLVNNEQCRLLASTKSHQHQQHKSSNKQEHFHLPDNSTNLAKVVCKGLNLNSIINKGSGDMRKKISQCTMGELELISSTSLDHGVKINACCMY